MSEESEDRCDGCGYVDTEICVVCVDGDCRITQGEREWAEALCDIMCPLYEGD